MRLRIHRSIEKGEGEKGIGHTGADEHTALVEVGGEDSKPRSICRMCIYRILKYITQSFGITWLFKLRFIETAFP
jgi:hypothetical protein